MDAPMPNGPMTTPIAPKTPSKAEERLWNLEHPDSGDYVGALNDADDFINDLLRQETAFQDRLEQVNRHAQRLAGELDRLRAIREGVQHAINQLYGYNVAADIPTPAESVERAENEMINRRAEANAKAAEIRRSLIQGSSR